MAGADNGKNEKKEKKRKKKKESSDNGCLKDIGLRWKIWSTETKSIVESVVLFW
jgi:hypothetical protein